MNFSSANINFVVPLFVNLILHLHYVLFSIDLVNRLRTYMRMHITGGHEMETHWRLKVASKLRIMAINSPFHDSYNFAQRFAMAPKNIHVLPMALTSPYSLGVHPVLS